MIRSDLNQNQNLEHIEGPLLSQNQLVPQSQADSFFNINPVSAFINESYSFQNSEFYADEQNQIPLSSNYIELDSFAGEINNLFQEHQNVINEDEQQIVNQQNDLMQNVQERVEELSEDAHILLNDSSLNTHTYWSFMCNHPCLTLFSIIISLFSARYLIRNYWNRSDNTPNAPQAYPFFNATRLYTQFFFTNPHNMRWPFNLPNTRGTNFTNFFNVSYLFGAFSVFMGNLSWLFLKFVRKFRR